MSLPDEEKYDKLKVDLGTRESTPNIFVIFAHSRSVWLSDKRPESEWSAIFDAAKSQGDYESCWDFLCRYFEYYVPVDFERIR